MTKKPKFKSEAFAAIHASAAALQRVGAIDRTTMRQFDASCLALDQLGEHFGSLAEHGQAITDALDEVFTRAWN